MEWNGRQKKDLRLIVVHTVDFCEHSTRMFRIQILTMDGGSWLLHNAQTQAGRSYEALACHGLVSEDGFTRSRISMALSESLVIRSRIPHNRRGFPLSSDRHHEDMLLSPQPREPTWTPRPGLRSVQERVVCPWDSLPAAVVWDVLHHLKVMAGAPALHHRAHLQDLERRTRAMGFFPQVRICNWVLRIRGKCSHAIPVGKP